MARAIARGLEQLGDHLGVDVCQLWRTSDEGDDLSPILTWAVSGDGTPIIRGPLRTSLPALFTRLQSDGAQWVDSLAEIHDPRERDTLSKSSVRSLALLPLLTGGRLTGALSLATMRAPRAWDPITRVHLRLASAVLSLALASRRDNSTAGGSSAATEAARRPLVQDRLRRTPIASESDAAREVLAQVDSVAPTPATVLLTGETGTGKEVFAQAIHDRSPRRDRPMVRVNCAAIPAALIESELFGRERGAYTGALSRQIGRFELASGGTLFLDEIGDLPLESQVKLLRAIQDRVVERLGGTDAIRVDVRVIAATNRDLAAAVAAKTFREDLYYRLNVFPIVVPPLRERLRDIPVLVWTFIEEFARASGKRIEAVAPESLAALQRHAWPGNVRELRNLVERAVILARGPRLVIEVPNGTQPPREVRGTLAEAQAAHIRAVLEQVGWRVRGTGGAAELLGMKPTTLDSRMARLGIRRPAGR